jgi:hypothetical protein
VAAHNDVDVGRALALVNLSAPGTHRFVRAVLGLLPFDFVLVFLDHLAEKLAIGLFVRMDRATLRSVRDVCNAGFLNLVGAEVILWVRHGNGSCCCPARARVLGRIYRTNLKFWQTVWT